MYRFYLFRLMLRPKGKQETLFKVRRGELLKKLLRTIPSGEVRQGHTWLVGADVNEFEENGIHFKAGRISTKRKDAFDHVRWRFVDSEGEDVEYTDCIFLDDIQVLAIGKRAGITAKPSTIANYLCKLINTIDVRNLDLTPEEMTVFNSSECVSPKILDPKGFLEHLRKSFKVSLFTVDFFFANPPNYKAMIQDPVEDYANYVDGEQSTLTVRNKSGLDTEALQESARAAAVSGTGNKVRARVHQSADDNNGTVVYMKKKGQDAYMDADETGIADSIREIGSLMRERFESLFSGEGDGRA